MSAVSDQLLVNEFLENHASAREKGRSSPDIWRNWAEWTGNRNYAVSTTRIHSAVKAINSLKGYAAPRDGLFSERNCRLVALSHADHFTGEATAKTLAVAYDCGVLNGDFGTYIANNPKYSVRVEEVADTWGPTQLIDKKTLDLIAELLPSLDRMLYGNRSAFYQALSSLKGTGLSLNQKNCSPFLEAAPRAGRVVEIVNRLSEQGVQQKERQEIFELLAEMIPNGTDADFEPSEVFIRGLLLFQSAGLMENPKIRASVIQNPKGFLKATLAFKEIIQKLDDSEEQQHLLYHTIFENLAIFQEAYAPLANLKMMDKEAFDLILKLVPTFEKTDPLARPSFFVGAALLKHSGLSLEELNCPNLLAFPFQLVPLIKNVEALITAKMPLAELQIGVGLLTDALPALFDLPITPALIVSLYQCKQFGLLETTANRAWVIQHPRCIEPLINSIRSVEDAEDLKELAKVLLRLNDGDFCEEKITISKLLERHRRPAKRLKRSKQEE